MGIFLMRQRLPTRRTGWTQEVRISGQKCYLTVNEYPDGRPGEIFIVVAKQGTFLRGVMDTLAMTVSLALQHGATVEMVIGSLRKANYPPNGAVEGSVKVKVCCSVTDWIAQELEAQYVKNREPSSNLVIANTEIEVPQDPSLVESTEPKVEDKAAGYISESWRTGA